jgi:site-specific DNA-methyltransferase (adenine-specific)
MRDDAEKPSARESELAAEWVPVEALRAWSRNPRLITDEQISRVADSIKRFGFSAPIVARRQDGEVIAGHTRLRAAVQLGLTKVPVRYMNLDPAEAHLLALADNRLTELTPWNNTELSSLLSEYGLVDATMAGWNSEDLEELATDLIKEGGGGDGEGAEEDEVPDPPKVPVTRPGDLWVLGEHRLVCGDSTDPRVWAQLMADEAERFDLVFTDPPYGVDYVGKTKDALPVHNDGAEGLAKLLDEAFEGLLQHCRPGAVWYVCAPPGPQLAVFGEALAKRKLWRQSIAWAKDQFVLGHSDYHYQHEQIFYGWVEGAHRPPPDRKQTTLWTFDRPKRSEDHPTTKPVKLVAHALGNSSVKGELVGDPFGGSGTTLVAAQQLERRCRTIEIGPEYCDVIVQRWEQATSGKAELRRPS